MDTCEISMKADVYRMLQRNGVPADVQISLLELYKKLIAERLEIEKKIVEVSTILVDEQIEKLKKDSLLYKTGTEPATE